MTLLVEVCAGSAALTRHLLGVGKLVGFMGGKDGYAEAIAKVWGCPRPSFVWLNDPGFWGSIWKGLLENPQAVGKRIEGFAEQEPRELWNWLRVVNSTGPDLAAIRLCQLAGTHGGGEIGGFKGKHIRRPNVDGYIPSRASLAQRVREVAVSVPAAVTMIHAETLFASDAWCYIDPPYVGTSGYVTKLDRYDVVETAIRLASARNHVAVSEAGPIEELIAEGWTAHELTTARKGQGRKNSRSSSEWLTIFKPN